MNDPNPMGAAVNQKKGGGAHEAAVLVEPVQGHAGDVPGPGALGGIQEETDLTRVLVP